MQKIFRKVLNENKITGTFLSFLRYYKTYRETYSFLQRSQWWSKEQIKQYQVKRLNKLLNHAYNHVLYYTKLFDKLGLRPNDIKSLKDLQKLPFLTREIVRDNVHDFKAKNYPAYKFHYTSTGGIVGTPLGFYVEKDVWMGKHVSFVKALMRRAGYRPIDKTISITGEKTFWKYHPLSRTLVLSSFYMTDDNLKKYFRKIMKFKPKYISSFPSALTVLATYAKEQRKGITPKIRGIFCSGETLFDWQRELIEETFQCRVYDQYGHREQCVLAGACEYTNYYHFFPEYGIVELIDDAGQPVTKEGEKGEIVATGLRSDIFPFIRYKTGDIGVYTTHKCKCGRNYPLLKKISGRTQDFLISKTNQLIPLETVYEVVVKHLRNVKESQFYQDTNGEIVLHIVKNNNFSNGDIQQIKDVFQEEFDEEFTLIIRSTDHIPRTSRGKFQFLIQKLQIKQ